VLERKATVKRQTRETTIALEFKIDGSGSSEMNTGNRMLDHLISQIARHGVFDIRISANGDDVHHVVEDVGLALGQAFNEALGEKRGIVRMADVSVPMDEALTTVAVDIGGRGYAVLDLEFAKNDMFEFPTDLVRHFLEAFAAEAKINLHAKTVYGVNDHHKAEALFKGLGRALDAATQIDPRIVGELPSTKEMI
jgi:imidazoleglycerol-phosphate dehydratase